MVIIRANKLTRRDQLEVLAHDIKEQAKTGVIVLPCWCELLSEVPVGEEIQILQQREDDRVAELEAELARAMFYISAQKDCTTCKHEMDSRSRCPADCENCSGEPCGRICQVCLNGSKWEWRGAHG